MKLTSTPSLVTFIITALLLCYLHAQGHILTFVPLSLAPLLWLIVLFPALGLLFCNTLLVLLFLPAIVVHRMNRPRLEGIYTRKICSGCEQDGHCQACSSGWKRLPVKTKEGLHIDAVQWIYQPLDGSIVEVNQQKWIMWCNANAVCYEDLMDRLVMTIGRPLRFNIILFNYQGVGKSSRQWPTSEEDLYNNGRAVFDAVVHTGADPQKILIYGHSLGSAIGAAVRQISPSGPFCSDRSFSSLGKTVAHHATGPNGFVVASAVGIYISCMHYLLMMCSWGSVPALDSFMQWVRILGTVVQAVKFTGQKYRVYLLLYVAIEIAAILIFQSLASREPGWIDAFCNFLRRIWLGQVLGALFWVSGGLQQVCPSLTRAIGWEMDQVGAWKSFKGPKLLIYHPGDGIIPPPVSLYAALRDTEDRDACAVILRKRWHDLEVVNPLEAGAAYHNYEVASYDKEQWASLQARIAALLD